MLFYRNYFQNISSKAQAVFDLTGETKPQTLLKGRMAPLLKPISMFSTTTSGGVKLDDILDHCHAAV